MAEMSMFQRVLAVSVLFSVCYAGLVERRQVAEAFATCTPA